MLSVQSFTFNPFGENTYLVYNENKDCIIFDPGMYDAIEQKELSDFIESNALRPVQLINTHCHIDHVMGNRYVVEKYKLELHASRLEIEVLKMGRTSALMYGLKYDESPEISHFIDESDVIMLGKDSFRIIAAPGHSPGSLCFYNAESELIISGDVLFNGSIGRSDLPGGDHQTLLTSISRKLYALPDATKVYSGHGPVTTIGHEKQNNPYVRG